MGFRISFNIFALAAILFLILSLEEGEGLPHALIKRYRRHLVYPGIYCSFARRMDQADAETVEVLQGPPELHDTHLTGVVSDGTIIEPVTIINNIQDNIRTVPYTEDEINLSVIPLSSYIRRDDEKSLDILQVMYNYKGKPLSEKENVKKYPTVSSEL